MTDDQKPIDLRKRIGVFEDTAEIVEVLRGNSRDEDIPSTVRYYMAEAAESMEGMYRDMHRAADRIDQLLQRAEPVATCEPSEPWRERGIYRPRVTWLVAPNTLSMGKFELYLVPPTSAVPEGEMLAWAVDSWHEQVANRPLSNIYRRTLDSVWRQVIKQLGGDDVALCGPPHDDFLDASGNPKAAPQQGEK